jgi:hypothetical protein
VKVPLLVPNQTFEEELPDARLRNRLSELGIDVFSARYVEVELPKRL